MGRRRSLLGILVSEMERSARKASSARARDARQAEGVRNRALEREMVREERARERARIHTERERERTNAEARIHSATLSKKEAKEAQLREWRREAEGHNQRDEELLQIGNESPEVEDREKLYSELMQPRPYEAPEFVPPELTEEQLTSIRTALSPRLKAAVDDFDSPAGATNALQLGLSLLTLGSGAVAMLPRAPADAAMAPVAGIAVWLGLEAIRRASRSKRFDAHMEKARAELEASAAKATESLRVQLEDRARASYEAQVATEKAGHEHEQRVRHAHLAALQQGDTGSMEKELRDMFPLEGGFEWEVRSVLKSASAVALDVLVPLSSVMQIRSASVLASGKVSYKKKTQKKFREDCERVVSGTALRHASEVMLLLPTLREVEVRCLLPRNDASTGRETEAVLLSVKFDYDTLAPLQMPEIDPFLAMKHFPHEANIKDVAAALLAKASE